MPGSRQSRPAQARRRALLRACPVDAARACPRASRLRRRSSRPPRGSGDAQRAGSYVWTVRLSRRCPNIRDTMKHNLPQEASRSDAGFSQSLERGLAILSAFKPERPLLGSERARARDRPEPQHHAPLRRDARATRLPAAGPAPAKYRLGPRVLDLGFSAINSMELREISRAAPAAAERRDRPHGEHGDPRRQPTSSTSSAAAARGRASARSTSTCTSARGCRPTARRWARCCSRTCRRMSARRCSPASS